MDESKEIAGSRMTRDPAEARHKEEQRLRERIRWIGASLASYALDTLFLSMFMLAGTIGAAVPLAYGLGAVIISVFSYLMHRSSAWTRRFEESATSTGEMIVAMALISGVTPKRIMA